MLLLAELGGVMVLSLVVGDIDVQRLGVIEGICYWLVAEDSGARMWKKSTGQKETWHLRKVSNNLI